MVRSNQTPFDESNCPPFRFVCLKVVKFVCLSHDVTCALCYSDFSNSKKDENWFEKSDVKLRCLTKGG